MDTAERLQAIEEIKQLKARYFRCMDEKDWAGLEAVFAPDLVADFRDSTGTRDESLLTHGAALYVKNLAPILEKITTTHHGHMPEIEITSATTATGIWAMEDLLWVGEGAPVPYKTMRGFGHYHETYEKIDGAWVIKTTRLSRLRVEVT
ncbi:MAG TPA: nuclear transport factor 2 family protein [Alphaproteobacteria bacterium]|jgi:hypothetical protein|nr:nuclear transport factor 2 family protein [Alphaproteobacteria bacterium]